MLMTVCIVSEIPCLYLSFHASIFFLDVPDMRFERTIFLFSLVNDAFEVIIFIPDKILCCHVAIKVYIRVEDVVI